MNIYDYFTQPKRTRFEEITLISEDAKSQHQKKDLIILDATLESNHTSTLMPSEHPVEKGSAVTDHLLKKPVILTVRGRIVKEPLSLVGAVKGSAVGALGLSSAGTGFSPVVQVAQSKLGGFLSNVSGGDRVQSNLELLLALQDDKVVFTVVTRLRVYENMILENFELPDDITKGDGIEFTCSLKEIRIVETETSIIKEKKIDNTVGHSSTKKENRGVQKKGIQSADKTTQLSAKKSLMAAGFDALGGS